MSEERNDLYKGKVEVLPPEQEGFSFGRVAYSSGFGRVKVVKLGPLSGALVALAIGLMMTFGFLFLGGFLLFMIPVLLVGGAGAYLLSRFGGSSRLPR